MAFSRTNKALSNYSCFVMVLIKSPQSYVLFLVKVESFPWPLPHGHGNGSDTISLLSAQCVTVTGFIGMPVPVAEHFGYLFLFIAKSACA